MFLSGGMSLEYLLICVLVFLVITLSVVLFKMYRQEDVLPFSALSNMSFYCKDLRRGTEFFSERLCRFLGRGHIECIEDFYQSFDDHNKAVLVEIFSKIKDAHQQDKHTMYSEPIAVINEKSGLTKYFVCSYATVVEPTTKILLKIFLFFYDVTNHVEHVNAMKREVSNIKSELVHKNSILNALPFPVWVRDKELKLQYFNTQFNYFIPYDQQYLSNLSFLGKEDELAKKAYDSKVMQTAELYMVINGTWHLYNFYEVPVPGSELLVGVGYSCEDKDKIRSELQRHIAAQADLLESTSSAVAIYGSDMKLKFFNHAFVKMWGLEEKWLVTQPSYSDFLNRLRSERKLPEQIDFQQFKNEQMSLFTDLTLTHNDFLYLPDGRSLRVIVIQHALGGLLFSYEDMTDRLALERSYRTLSAVQKSTIDHLNEGITVFSEDGRLQVSNDQFSRIWTFPKDILSTKPHMVVVIDKMIEQVEEVKKNTSFRDEFFLCVNSRETRNFQIKKTDGSIIDALFVPLPDGATLICYRDITDTIMVEKILVDKNLALQEADRLKTEFLANMSYELRSPLTSIIGFSGLLEGKHFGLLNDKQLEYVNAINDSSKYLMSLINDILDVASIEAGYMTLDIEKVDLREAIKSVVELVSQRISGQSIKLNISDIKKDLVGMCDMKRIKQVIFKMLNNAVGRTLEKGEVSLFVRCINNKYVVLSIKDYGDYVSVEDQNQIFNKFYGMGNAITAKNKDNLGLSLVKSIVEMHGGRVCFVSKQNEYNVLRAIIPLNNKELILDNKIDNNSVEQMVS